MRKIAICASFIPEDCRVQINALSRSLGFQTAWFSENSEDFENCISEFEIIFGNPSPHLLAKAENLRWLSSIAAGIEPYLEEGIWANPNCMLTSGSGAYGVTISEHILMFLLMLMRRMPEYLPATAQHQWPYFTPIRSIAGSRITILGTGDIGRNTARRLRAMGAEITGVCRSGKCEEPAFSQVFSISELDSVLPNTDALIMALPATAETKGLLSRERIALLPASAYIINVGRGTVLDQQALVDALQAKAIAGAALDVTVPEPLPQDHPLWNCPNTIITPHVSGTMSLGLTCWLAVHLFCCNLERYAAEKPLENLVDRARGY